MGTKKSDAKNETLQNVRERANKRFALHNSLGILSRFHLRKIADKSNDKGDIVNTVFPKTMCSGCKRVLCFDHDRREEIIDLLNGEDGHRLRQEFPSLSKNLRRCDAPAYYTEIGEVNERRFVMGMSCWHLAHPNNSCSPCNEEDAQLSSVIAAGKDVYSPQLSE